MMENKPRASPKHRTKPNADTWFGRHQEAMDFIAREFHDRPGPSNAWVIGIGGRTGVKGNLQFTPTEHLEVAIALQKAGIKKFRVHALDVSREAIGLARKLMEKEKGIRVCTKHPAVLNPKKRPEKTGPNYSHLLAIPDRLKYSIVFHGPNENGDAFLFEPNERPEVITVFNVARSYHRRHQAKLARKLSEALIDGGVLLTNKTDNQTVFVRVLTEILGEPVDLGPTHDEGKDGKILAFKKRIWELEQD